MEVKRAEVLQPAVAPGSLARTGWLGAVPSGTAEYAGGPGPRPRPGDPPQDGQDLKMGAQPPLAPGPVAGRGDQEAPGPQQGRGDPTKEPCGHLDRPCLGLVRPQPTDVVQALWQAGGLWLKPADSALAAQEQLVRGAVARPQPSLQHADQPEGTGLVEGWSRDGRSIVGDLEEPLLDRDGQPPAAAANWQAGGPWLEPADALAVEVQQQVGEAVARPLPSLQLEDQPEGTGPVEGWSQGDLSIAADLKKPLVDRDEQPPVAAAIWRAGGPWPKPADALAVEVQQQVGEAVARPQPSLQLEDQPEDTALVEGWSQDDLSIAGAQPEVEVVAPAAALDEDQVTAVVIAPHQLSVKDRLAALRSAGKFEAVERHMGAVTAPHAGTPQLRHAGSKDGRQGHGEQPRCATCRNLQRRVLHGSVFCIHCGTRWPTPGGRCTSLEELWSGLHRQPAKAVLGPDAARPQAGRAAPAPL